MYVAHRVYIFANFNLERTKKVSFGDPLNTNNNADKILINLLAPIDNFVASHKRSFFVYFGKFIDCFGDLNYKTIFLSQNIFLAFF